MKTEKEIQARMESYQYIKDDTKINLCGVEKDRIQLMIEALKWILEE